jgi:cytochrome P450
VAEKKRLIRDIYDGKIDKGTDIGKDVLSLLIRSNMAPDLREDQKMDDEEIMHQISTVLFAGHETTGTALMWALHQLANNPEIQERLREEILTVPDDQPSL